MDEGSMELVFGRKKQNKIIIDEEDYDLISQFRLTKTDSGDKPLQEVLIKECGLIKIDVPQENNDNSVEV